MFPCKLPAHCSEQLNSAKYCIIVAQTHPVLVSSTLVTEKSSLSSILAVNKADHKANMQRIRPFDCSTFFQNSATRWREAKILKDAKCFVSSIERTRQGQRSDLRVSVLRETAFVVRITASLLFLSFLHSVFPSAVTLDQANDDANL